MDAEYCRLLVEAYRGELFGEAFFGALADRETDAGRVEKLQVLRRIESTTASQLRPLLDAAGVEMPADEAAAAQAQGRELGAADLDWQQFVRGLHDALPSFLADFVRLRAIAQDPGDPALAGLVAHEQAVNAFAELELGGRPDCSLAVLEWHLEAVS